MSYQARVEQADETGLTVAVYHGDDRVCELFVRDARKRVLAHNISTYIQYSENNINDVYFTPRPDSKGHVSGG